MAVLSITLLNINTDYLLLFWYFISKRTTYPKPIKELTERRDCYMCCVGHYICQSYLMICGWLFGKKQHVDGMVLLSHLGT